MKSIDQSPTKNEVVKETLDIALKVMDEVEQTFIEVTYDLNIAYLAMKIQHTWYLKYAKIFIHLGLFHVEMAYFHAVGKCIDYCGVTNIVVDSKLLANGSANGFILGKHYSLDAHDQN